MEKVLKTLGVHINSPDGAARYVRGGLIFCARCKRILGYLNADGYRDLRMILHCKCGNTGFLKTELSPELCSARRMLRANGTVWRCADCAAPLFSLRKEMLHSFSFQIVCKCSAAYMIDISEDPKRRHSPEQLQTFLKGRKGTDKI